MYQLKSGKFIDIYHVGCRYLEQNLHCAQAQPNLLNAKERLQARLLDNLGSRCQPPILLHDLELTGL
jgi:hypothetical protein